MSGKTKFERIPMWCPRCDQEGTLPAEDPSEPLFIRCSACKHETAYVWCDHCEVGGTFINDLADRPTTWTCGSCSTIYSLPTGFYDHPVELTITHPKPPKSTPPGPMVDLHPGGQLLPALLAVVILITMFFFLYWYLQR